MRRLAEDAAERSEVETSVVSGVDDEDAAAEEEAVVEGGGGGTPSPVTRADLECDEQAVNTYNLQLSAFRRCRAENSQ